MKIIWLACLLLASSSLAKPPSPATHPASTTEPNSEPATYTVKVVPDLVFAKPGGIELLIDLHLPEGVKNPPLVMFIHGGGWSMGTRKTFRVGWLVERGYAVASIEYRMSKEAIFPAQIHDCKGALRWLRAHSKEHGYNADKVVVCGMSAGGHLAALMGSSGGVKELEGTTAGHLEQSSLVQGVIDYCGPADFIQRSKSQPKHTESPKGIVYRLLGGAVTENLEPARLASPVSHVGPGDPPILIFHGELDPQVLPAQSKRLLDVYEEHKLDAQLHMIAGKKHLWAPPTQKELTTIPMFLEKHLR